MRLLVKRGVLTQSDADGLIAQANAEASQAQKLAGTANAAPATPGHVRVTYVPEVVRNQIRDEVKAEVLAEARAENWAQPQALPEWIRRIAWSGDLRFRDESDFYGSGNIGGLDASASPPSRSITMPGTRTAPSMWRRRFRRSLRTRATIAPTC